MTKISAIITGVLIVLLVLSSLAATSYYKKYVTLTITIQKNNDTAKKQAKEYKEEYDKKLKEITEKHNTLQKKEERLNEELRNINVDYSNLRLRYEQREHNRSREADLYPTETNQPNETNTSERDWVLYREIVEDFRNELEALNLAYTSCYELTSP